MVFRRMQCRLVGGRHKALLAIIQWSTACVKLPVSTDHNNHDKPSLKKLDYTSDILYKVRFA